MQGRHKACPYAGHNHDGGENMRRDESCEKSGFEISADLAAPCRGRDFFRKVLKNLCRGGDKQNRWCEYDSLVRAPLVGALAGTTPK